MKDTERHHYIGEHICALRESKGWTQQTLGKKLGKKTSTISAYETNAKLPSADCLIEMAEVFGVSIDTLVYGETADLVSVRTLNPHRKPSLQKFYKYLALIHPKSQPVNNGYA